MICVNAARSCVHVLDFIRKKFGQGSQLAAVVLHYSLVREQRLTCVR